MSHIETVKRLTEVALQHLATKPHDEAEFRKIATAYQGLVAGLLGVPSERISIEIVEAGNGTKIEVAFDGRGVCRMDGHAWNDGSCSCLWASQCPFAWPKNTFRRVE